MSNLTPSSQALYRYKNICDMITYTTPIANSKVFPDLFSVKLSFLPPYDNDLINTIEKLQKDLEFKYFLELYIERNISNYQILSFITNNEYEVTLLATIFKNALTEANPNKSINEYHGVKSIEKFTDNYNIISQYKIINGLYKLSNDAKTELNACDDIVFQYQVGLCPYGMADWNGIQSFDIDEVDHVTITDELYNIDKIREKFETPRYPSNISDKLLKLHTDNIDFLKSTAQAFLIHRFTIGIDRELLDIDFKIVYQNFSSWIYEANLCGYNNLKINKLSPFEIDCDARLFQEENCNIFVLISSIYSTTMNIIYPVELDVVETYSTIDDDGNQIAMISAKIKSICIRLTNSCQLGLVYPTEYPKFSSTLQHFEYLNNSYSAELSMLQDNIPYYKLLNTPKIYDDEDSEKYLLYIIPILHELFNTDDRDEMETLLYNIEKSVLDNVEKEMCEEYELYQLFQVATSKDVFYLAIIGQKSTKLQKMKSEEDIDILLDKCEKDESSFQPMLVQSKDLSEKVSKPKKKWWWNR